VRKHVTATHQPTRQSEAALSWLGSSFQFCSSYGLPLLPHFSCVQVITNLGRAQGELECSATQDQVYVASIFTSDQLLLLRPCMQVITNLSRAKEELERSAAAQRKINAVCSIHLDFCFVNTCS
jgi:hypothetical protein